MRHWIALVIIFLSAVSVTSAGGPVAVVKCDAWRDLPVLDNGRHKPFDTLASETARFIGIPANIADSETGEKLDPVALYLTLLFDWDGENKPLMHSMAGVQSYFTIHKPDEWDKMPLLYVDNSQLRDALGLPPGEKYISPLKLNEAKYRDPNTGKEIPFSMQVQKLVAHKEQHMPALDKKTLNLADALLVYQQTRMGETLSFIPVKGIEPEEWISAARLQTGKYDDTTDPSGLIRKAQEQYLKARAAFRAHNADEFNAAIKALLAVTREIGESTGTYPTQYVIDVEIAYNHWMPFRFAWILSALTLVLLLVGKYSNSRIFYRAALTVYVACLAAVIIGFTMRTIISGRAPVTNMFESVVYLGFGAIVFGLFMEWFSRKGFLLSAAATISTIALVLADFCPVTLDPSLRPLPPVLRSNFWLTIHVMTITASYAAFSLAWRLGNITLGYYFARSRNRETIAFLTKSTYQTLKAGVLLLLIGTLLGAFWADYSWGRFWGWDPKEVWALITLLLYASLLHARLIPWLGNLGMAVCSVLCLSAVIMAWYGVNFLMGTGMHSYGSGGGGQDYVFVIVAVIIILQFSYVIAAVIAATLNPQEDKAVQS